MGVLRYVRPAGAVPARGGYRAGAVDDDCDAVPVVLRGHPCI